MQTEGKENGRIKLPGFIHDELPWRLKALDHKRSALSLDQKQVEYENFRQSDYGKKNLVSNHDMIDIDVKIFRYLASGLRNFHILSCPEQILYQKKREPLRRKYLVPEQQ